MNIQSKLILEQVVFNFLMYAILLIGGLAAILVDMIGTLWHPSACWYVTPIIVGSTAAAGLCHFFVHYTAHYLTLNGDEGIKEYEQGRKQSNGSGAFVGFANFVIFSMIISVTIHSLLLLSQTAEPLQVAARVMFLLMGLGVFFFAPIGAKGAWKREK